MKKFDMSKLLKVKVFSLSLLLLSAAEKPTLNYDIIWKSNYVPPSTSMHPSSANHPTRGCNAENLCRHFTLSVENPSGSRLLAFGIIVEVGAPLNTSESGTEAIAAGIAAWSLNKTNVNTSGRLGVSIDSIANVDSAQLLQAVSEGVSSVGLDVQYRYASMSAEDVASLPPVDGNISITVDTASNQVGLKFFTHVQSLGETDLVHILEYAKAKLQAIHK